ncbi:DHA2 family efflux MFS transporter permease subunit [Actinokineospora xionganensis]|uniref:DHA2 family efflux MFS transporter permease subunit n=1 Tax=Actinokineospora xionganensis TaxID=2684470 RepID=A0ABR7L8M0_9PSEU|nr:DHA2 family efflux MFS transporter permease subunit [Actinokineospora xionganensis]MBC6449036.1 DHA2 family efflux MFS transporter permease subunit [Actinokineospora xionganensis]
MTRAEPKPDARPDKLDAVVWRAAIVVVIGSFMAILDTTVVNVALPALTAEFHTSFATIHWVVTGYMLALTMAIPVTGWACDRFGARALYLVAIALFMLGSILAATAWSVGSLIAFRVVQGLGAGMLGPAGTTILVKAAGPRRVGRVMGVLGVPMLLGPITGPIVGGWLVDAADWRWIFLINIPISVVAFVLAWRMLPRDEPESAEPFDFLGMLLLSPGLALVIFSAVLIASGTGAAAGWLPGVVGVLGIAGFLVRATRIGNPLIDLALFKDRTFTISAIGLSIFFVGFLGGGLLYPAYFLLARGESALQAGLLLVPSSVGAMIAIPMCGLLADKFGPGRVVLSGLVLILPSLAVFTQVTAATPYWPLVLAMFVMGLGMGATMIPLMSAAMLNLTSRQVARASTTLSILQQASGAVGAAVLSMILAGSLAGKFGVPTERGQAAATEAMDHLSTRDAAAALVADSFATTFACALGLVALCLVPAFLLPRRPAPAPVDEPIEVPA